MIKIQELQSNPMALVAVLAMKNKGKLKISSKDLEKFSLDGKELEIRVKDGSMTIQVVDEPVEAVATDVETVNEFIERMEKEKEEAGGDVVQPS